jgi:hypothetical protein
MEQIFGLWEVERAGQVERKCERCTSPVAVKTDGENFYG